MIDPNMMGQPQAQPQGQPTDAMSQVSGMGMNMSQLPEPAKGKDARFEIFDAPVPGQSLTNEPGNAAWERPPQFPDLDKAADYIFRRLMEPASTKGILTFLRRGISVEALAKVILFTGFSEGKWTPDVMLMLFKPVVLMIAAMGIRAKIKNIKVTMKDNSTDKVVENIVKDVPDYNKGSQTLPMLPPNEMAGLMARGGK